MVTASKAGRYEILGELGRGAMGVVYRAKDPLIGRIVATKMIQLSDEGTGESFLTEARAAGLLTHPNIVVIYDVGECDGGYYITMELINGKSLQSLLDAGEKFPLTRLLRIIEQVCSALQFAHNNHVVHRDIKPANIMLTRDDSVKITDFGTAKILEYGATSEVLAMGTPGYMSPEQIKGKPIDGRTDIFSLGVMLYELTVGQKPFRGEDVGTVMYNILNQEPVPPHQLNPNIPPGVSSTILKALAKSPHLRYESCKDLLEDLKHFRPGVARTETNAGSSATMAPAPPPTRTKLNKNFYETPQIPGVERRAASPAPSKPRPAQPASVSTGSQQTGEKEIPGVYAGPPKSNFVKRFAKIGGGLLLAAVLGSYAYKMIGRSPQPAADTSPAVQDNTPAQPKSAERSSSPRAPHVSQSNPEVATTNELARPWSSKSFYFRSLTLSKDVAAIIIRLPGAASESESYWALSLDAPFSNCQFEYIDDLAKLSSEYGFRGAHPMVVNPCSHAVFDPAQRVELPGNVFVRGAIAQGSDVRPPYSIEVRVRGNQIEAVAMEQ